MLSLRRASIAASALCAIAAAAILSAQSGNPLTGNWTINLAKSKYSPANLALKSSTSRFDATQNEVKLLNEGVDAQGRTTRLEYTARFDGKPYPVKSTIDGKPSPNQDSVTWKKIDDYTYENVAMLKGKALTTTRVTISRDGKTRTNTVTGQDAQGRTINNTVVYEKQ
jgi:hypothetical protein